LPIDGIVLPNLVGVDDVKRALRFTRLPPKGIRSLGNERNDVIWGAYSEPEPLIGMLVEHPGAVAEIDDILATGEISFTWIGVHDLSALMNLDPHEIIQPNGKLNPPLQAAADKVQAASQRAGVPFWGGFPDSDAIIAGVDARMIRKFADDTLAAKRAL
jgi:2-keto-3-deoxy-L-rhamnonate aldolase RhmA